jgi:hypothetical protein
MNPLLDLVPAAEPASLPWFRTCCARCELPAAVRLSAAQIGAAGFDDTGGIAARGHRHTGLRRQREHASREATGAAKILVPVEDLADLAEMLERRGMLAPRGHARSAEDRRRTRPLGRSVGRGLAKEGLRAGGVTRQGRFWGRSISASRSRYRPRGQARSRHLSPRSARRLGLPSLVVPNR